jgi:hypothetical protein
LTIPTDDPFVTREHRHGDRRHRGPNWSMISVVIAILINFGGLVWGAATLVGGMGELRGAVTELKFVGRSLADQANINSVRLGVLEVKVDDLRDRVRGKR